MSKELSEMTLEELWTLFPIFLVPHDERWRGYYQEAEENLKSVLPSDLNARISHIGSTAVSDIWAKNIVDVLLEIPADADMERVASLLENAGWLRMSTEKDRGSFNRGYTKNGFADKVYHLHLRRAGDNDELYFRDYLNARSETAKEYEALKLRLWKEFERDRDAYTAAKTEFVRRWTAEAKREFPGRY